MSFLLKFIFAGIGRKKELVENGEKKWWQ